MKTTIVIYGSSTGSCQSIAETIIFCIFAQNIKYKKIIGKEENMIVGRKEEIAELN